MHECVVIFSVMALLYLITQRPILRVSLEYNNSGPLCGVIECWWCLCTECNVYMCLCVCVCVRGRTSASSIWVRPTSWITWSCHRCFCLPSGYLMKFLTSHTECNATGLTEERRYIVCCIFVIERLWGLSLRTPSLPGTIFMRVDRRWEENEMAHFLATSIIGICCIFFILPFAQWGKSAAWYLCPTAYDIHWQWGWLRMIHTLPQEILWADVLALPVTAPPPVLFPMDTSLETLQLWQSKCSAQTLPECFTNQPGGKTRACTLPPVKKWVLKEDVKKSWFMALQKVLSG